MVISLVFISFIIVGGGIIKTWATWLLLAAWLQFKTKTSGQIRAGPWNSGLVRQNRNRVALIRRQILFLTHLEESMSVLNKHISRGTDFKMNWSVFCHANVHLPLIHLSNLCLFHQRSPFSFAGLSFHCYFIFPTVTWEKISRRTLLLLPVPSGHMECIVKMRLKGNQSKCGWCHFSLAVTLCNICLLHNDKLKQ